MNQGTAGLAAAVPESGRKRSRRDFPGLTAEECLTCQPMSRRKVRAGLHPVPESDAQLTRAVPHPGGSGGILFPEKAGKTKKFPLFHEKSPGGTSPGAYRGVQRRIYAVYRGIPLYAVAGTSYGTRSGFRCNPGRNPGAIFSSRPSRAIPTRDPSERRMPGGNRDSDIMSEAPSVAGDFRASRHLSGKRRYSAVDMNDAASGRKSRRNIRPPEGRLGPKKVPSGQG